MIRNSITTAWRAKEPSQGTDGASNPDEERIAEILDQYLEAIESGRAISMEEVLSNYPQYADEMRPYLEGIHMLHRAPDTETQALPYEEINGGQALGDYQLVREVGRGGMGVVYESRQLSLNRRVALKVLPFAAMLDVRQIQRFENEARAAAQLDHPNIVPVYGVGCDRGVHYFAMQFIEGQTLSDVISELAQEATVTTQRDESPETNPRSCPRSARSTERFREIARVGLQAANAIHSAHQCGVIHRDIKPSNLMLDGRGKLWITDFGLARVQSDNAVTRSGDIVGTLHYMSPEQATGNATIADPRSDVYSLAVTLYELVTLRRPFEGATHSEVLRRIERGTCKPPSYWNTAIPRDLENVIVKGMSPEPIERYPSAADFEKDLQRFLDGKPTHAKPPNAFQVLTKWAARNRSIVVSAITALLTIIAALSVMNVSLVRGHNALRQKNAQLDRGIQAANQRHDVAVRSLESFGLEVADFLKEKVPGSEAEREKLLREMLLVYEDLLSSFEESPSLLRDAAITNTKMATVFHKLGKRDAALEAYREAQRLLQDLPDGQSEYAQCLNSSGLILAELGNTPAATVEIQEAISIQRELLARDSEQANLMALADSLTNLGSVSPTHREAAFDQALQLISAAHREHPNDQRLLRSLMTATGNRASLLSESDPYRAITFANVAVQKGLSLCALSGKSADANQLAISCSNLGTLYAQTNQHRRAVEAYRLAADRHRDTSNDSSLVITLSNLAKTQRTLGLNSQAALTYQEAIDVQQSVLNRSPGDLNHVSRLGGLYNNLGFMLNAERDMTSASKAYDAALEYQQRAFAMAKHIKSFRSDYSRTLYNAAKVAFANRDWEKSAQTHLTRARLWPTDIAQRNSAASGITAAAGNITDENRRTHWLQQANLLRASSQEGNEL